MGKPFTRKQIIGHLEKLNSRWNDKYWLFAADGTLHLMSKSRDGSRMTTPDGGMSPKALITTFTGIECDGGDW